MRRLMVVLVTSGALLLASGTPAHAATTTVSVGDNFFSPATTSVARGTTVLWRNDGVRTHTTTGAAPLSLWNKGLPRGGTFSQTFVAAGTYAYHCTIHFGMDGTVRVPIAASPAVASVATTITITVASAAAPSGFVYVVQKKDPGGSFATYKTITTKTTTFKTIKIGTYQFRAALKRSASSAASGFSAPKSVTIN